MAATPLAAAAAPAPAIVPEFPILYYLPVT